MAETTFGSSIYPAPDHIVALHNPVSKNGARGLHQLSDLKEYSQLHCDVIPTDQDADVTAERLSGLAPTDLLYVIGGDGTVNSALVPAIEKQPLVLATRSGNANDLAMTMNGKKAPWKVYAETFHGSAHDILVSPLEIHVDTDTLFAINYASFGYAALASHYLNQPWQHTSLKSFYDLLPPRVQAVARLPREAMLLAQAAKDMQPFHYIDPVDNEAKQVSDVSVVHSGRMAKLGRIQVRHTDPHMFYSELPDSSIVEMTHQFIKMMSGSMKGKDVCGVSFEVLGNGDQLYFQVDGEAHPLPDKSKVNVTFAQKPVRILSTLLQ